jgi:transposase-like protein
MSETHNRNQSSNGQSATPPTEVKPKATRRRFTKEYKLKILKEADACKKPGELGALLRREGLWSSHLSTWRAARDRGELVGRGSRKRGPKATTKNPLEKRVRELERENARLLKRAKRAEGLVEVQKKVAELFGETLPTVTDEELDEITGSSS